VYASDLMKKEIRKAYEEIWARIETAVQAGATGADGDGPRRQSEPLAAIGSHAARLKGALISVESLVAEAEREGTIGTSLAEKIHDTVRLDDEGG
jgi:hypothetical protein